MIKEKCVYVITWDIVLWDNFVQTYFNKKIKVKNFLLCVKKTHYYWKCKIITVARVSSSNLKVKWLRESY